LAVFESGKILAVGRLEAGALASLIIIRHIIKHGLELLASILAVNIIILGLPGDPAVLNLSAGIVAEIVLACDGEGVVDRAIVRSVAANLILAAAAAI
jgi:hypothetical protein